MELVCRICGYSEVERRKEGCAEGGCRIPREVGKPDAKCLMNAMKENFKSEASELLD